VSTITLSAWSLKLGRSVDSGLRDAAVGALAKVKPFLEAKAKLNAGPPRMRVRSGALRRSIAADLWVHGDDIDLYLEAGGGEVKYAAAQEFGHPGIVPVRAQYLAIPFGSALTPAGRLLSRFRNVSSLRQVKGLFVFRSKNGNLILGWRKKGELQAGWFLTKGPIVLKPRRYLRDAIDEARVRVLSELFAAATAEVKP
jgi:hypothetical protein